MSPTEDHVVDRWSETGVSGVRLGRISSQGGGTSGRVRIIISMTFLSVAPDPRLGWYISDTVHVCGDFGGRID
jgi:hypothetical protein